MANRYTDDDDRLRCSTCDGYVVVGKKCLKCRNRKLKARAEANARERAAERQAKKGLEAEQIRAWRVKALRRHANRILGLQGAERLAFMETHPVSALFR